MCQHSLIIIISMMNCKNFPFLSVEMDFQCLDGPRNVSVDLKYDVLCL